MPKEALIKLSVRLANHSTLTRFADNEGWKFWVLVILLMSSGGAVEFRNWAFTE